MPHYIEVLIDTPSPDQLSQLGTVADIELRAFRCRESEEGDIWMGEMEPGEDGNLVMDNHPLIDTACSFPTMSLHTMPNIPTGKQRCNGYIINPWPWHDICSYADQGSFFHPRLDAGFSCNGGTHNERDSNDGLTEDECVSEGGTWLSYACRDARSFLNSNLDPDLVQTMEYFAEFWYAPKCCLAGNDVEKEETAYQTAQDSPLKSSASRAGSIIAFSLVLLSYLLLVSGLGQQNHC